MEQTRSGPQRHVHGANELVVTSWRCCPVTQGLEVHHLAELRGAKPDHSVVAYADHWDARKPRLISSSPVAGSSAGFRSRNRFCRAAARKPWPHYRRSIRGWRSAFIGGAATSFFSRGWWLSELSWCSYPNRI